jgi:hypothetical protein
MIPFSDLTQVQARKVDTRRLIGIGGHGYRGRYLRSIATRG